MTTDSHPANFPLILQRCWNHLSVGAKDRRSAFHHPVVATVGLDGKPKSRVVILREANATKNILRFNVDVRTKKWEELKAQPAISLAFYEEFEKTQMRVEGVAVLHQGDDIAKKAWENSQRMSRIGYGAFPGPGAVMTDPEHVTFPETDEQIALGFENFGTISIRVKSIEWLYLQVRGNRRAVFDLEANTAQWQVP